MIGQSKIKSRLFIDSVNDLPHSLLFVGSEGCGKHLIANELSNHFNIPLIDISDNISLDLINEISLKPIQTFYLIDTSKLTDRTQNVILKFLEEPNQYTYIILLATNKSYLLNTVVNRCVSYEFEPYTKDELRTFIKSGDSALILNLCDTPGKILSLNNNLNNLLSLCDTIVEKLDKANYANTLSIVSKINLKDEFDKFDFNLFFNALLISIKSHYQNSGNDRYLFMYDFVCNYAKRLRDARLNREYLLENFLTTYWEFVRC